MSVDEALRVLREEAAGSRRALSALDTLTEELGAGRDRREKPGRDKPGFPKDKAAERFGGNTSARGTSHSHEARGSATARNGSQ